MIICPKCKSGEYLKKVSDVYIHFQHKDAVKKFFGSGICEMPDYLKDSEFEILEKTDEYKITRGAESTLQEDITLEDDPTAAILAVDVKSNYGIDKKTLKEVLPENISPPAEPVLLKLPIIIIVISSFGAVLTAAFIGLCIIRLVFLIDEPNKFLLIFGLFLLSISSTVFLATSFKNHKILQQYEESLGRWKELILCSRCRVILPFCECR